MKRHFLWPLLLAFSATSFAASPTPAQLEMFKALPKAEQEKLLKQYAPGLGGGSAPTSVAPVTQSVVTPREVEQELKEDAQVKEANQALDKADLTEKQVTTQVKEQILPFGYDLFAGNPITFAPIDNAPVPADYLLGPGDSLNVQIYGAQNDRFSLLIDREGRVQVPNVGPMQVAGLRFNEAKNFIDRAITKAIMGVETSITAGALRSIRIFVLGDVFRPGAYVVSGLSTFSNALYSSGGIKPIGSLRSVQLKRRGQVISTLDLYDFLLKGDMQDDLTLQDGDVIFVPSVQSRISIAGEVLRPAIYELKGEKTLDDVIKLAGGFTQSASPVHSKLERMREDGYREVLDVNLLNAQVREASPRNGDVVRVLPVLDEYKDIVLVNGSVSRPGEYQWREGMRIADLFKGRLDDELLPRTDLQHVFIKREAGVERSTVIKHVNLAQALASVDSSENILLQARDAIMVLGYDQNRVEVLKPWVEILKRQAKRDQLPLVVSIKGSVNYPGEYPLAQGMTDQQLISMAGGRSLTAQTVALVTHENQQRELSVELIDLSATQSKPLALGAMDSLIVLDMQNAEQNRGFLDAINERLKRQADAQEPTQVVSIGGYVKFPGEYPLTKNASIEDLLFIAGGLSESAYRLEAEITRSRVSADSELFEKVHQRVSLSSESTKQYTLQPMDSLVVKKIPDWAEVRKVEIIGEVKFPGTYVLQKHETLADLLKRVGGFTPEAYVDGLVFTRERIKQVQERELEGLRLQLQSILAQNTSKKSDVSPEASEHLNKIMQQANQAQATGRLSMALDYAASEPFGVFNEVVLEDADRIYIPSQPKVVSVMGEVFSAQTFLYREGMSAEDYIAMSGGANSLADLSRAYVVRANGLVMPLKSQNLLSDLAGGIVIAQGDTIVVPMDVQKLQPLEFWREIATIAGQVGIALASFKTVGLF